MSAAALTDAVTAVQRLARAHIVPDALLAALDGPLSGAVATVAEYAGSALSEATKRAYGRDWFHFADWCRKQAVDPTTLPIHPVLVAAYLASLATTLGRSALNGRLAAIAYEHRRRGLAWNAGHPAIRETLQGVGRKHGKPVRPAAALTSVEIKLLLASCREDLAGLRDRALFLVGFAGALRRSELVAVDHDHLRFEAGSVTIHIPRSKRDQEGKGADVTLPRMRDAAGAVSETCPVQALERWLARARIRRGAVFRGVTVGGRLGDRLSTDGVRHILLSRAKLAKLTVHASERLSPHGLRAGCITEAYLAAAPDEAIKSHTRHLGENEAAAFGAGEPLALPDPDWLLNRLTISGPAGTVARFRAVAQGTNAAPWHLDLDEEEARLFAPMATGGIEARVLAKELREIIAARHDRVLALWAGPGTCPLDLHRLIPIPLTILQLGEHDSAARRWLWAHWGTTRPLHQVRVVDGQGDKRLRRSARVTIEFLSADWTPWQAIRRLRRDWPELVFDIRPDYGSG